MSLIQLESGVVQVTGEALKPVLKKAGLKLDESLIQDYSTLLSSFEAAVGSLADDGPVQPRPDLEKYPRTDIHVPQDTEFGAWATKVTAKCIAPTSNLLEGRTVAVKDNIALAGVRCTNGTAMVEWTPEVDATIVTRVMDAGAIITGKAGQTPCPYIARRDGDRRIAMTDRRAACENACMEGISCTSVTGPVHNPHALGYSAGGSSSGCGRLVATGAVDLALGCDQGGSVRVPAAACGVVGHKPTWGLVPYTGIISLDATIDHAGPMARTVRECALLLDVIAGPDGWDDRQPPIELGNYPSGFVRDVDAVARLPRDAMLSGVRVGILSEGFQIPGHDERVSESVRAAAMRLSELGATVSSVSVPKHLDAMVAWMCAVPASSPRDALLGDKSGRKELYMPDRCALVGEKLTQAQFEALGPGASYMYLAYLWAQERYGSKLYSRCMNLLKAASDAYDAALKEVDVLITPTTPNLPTRLPAAGYSEGPLKFMGLTTGVLANTCPLNSTGHPAISIPVGFSPAAEDPNVKLPVGMQIIGRKYRDIDCLKVAAAWEKAFDWKTL